MTADIRQGDYAEVLHDVRADLIFTSPPYNLGGKAERKDGFRKFGLFDPKSCSTIRDYKDDLPEDEYQDSQARFLIWCADHLTPGGAAVYNHKERKRDKALIEPAEWYLRPDVKTRLLKVETIWWDRGSTTNHDKTQLWAQSERLHVFRRVQDRATYRFDPRILPKQYRSDIWRIPKAKKPDELPNSCPFPLDLAKAVISAWSRPGDLVCDPYLGTGTTAAAALELGRRFVGAEIVPTHAEYAKARVAQPHPFSPLWRWQAKA